MRARSGVHKSPDMLQMNPRGQVPVFIDAEQGGSIPIYESLAILSFLEMAYPRLALLPDSNSARGVVLMRMQETNNWSAVTMDFMRSVKRAKVGEPLGGHCRAFIARKRELLRKEMALWDRYIGSNTFLAGAQITLADVSFFPLLAFAVRCGLCLDEFAQLGRYYRIMEALPAVQATWPPHWRGEHCTAYMSDKYMAQFPSAPPAPPELTGSGPSGQGQLTACAQLTACGQPAAAAMSDVCHNGHG